MKKSKKEDIIWWKVVNENRRSVIVDRCSTGTSITDALALTYNKGEIVRAKHGSYGCFCFADFYNAQQCCSTEPNSLIIRVKPVGTIKPTPEYVPELRNRHLRDVRNDVRALKLGITVEEAWEVPISTVCCTAVEVLD